ncbi:dTMP kinase [Paludifilum halophilum]|uniref:Thymidylate kinase n=1 Tax=Paludifilum halophilum TaxID=1642702 RepID=A0A235B255_9BACL|nr:dTMP kinase [Paludifilum halophilum]OYD06390.1 dTMP kinase [Paludifilum halophilum]
MKGCFITLEGSEGGGKSTQAALISQYMDDKGIPYLTTREPGGTAIGDRVRRILLDPSLSEMALRTEILLYAASRAQLVEQVIRPALNDGKVVICDRYVDSSIVYQAYGPGGDLQEVIDINQTATGGLKPDRTYILDLPVEEGNLRLKSRGYDTDRMEQKGRDFHRRVRRGFLEQARLDPERCMIVDATRSAEEVFEILRSDLEKWIRL